jgi:hypothetical protein
MSGVLLVHQPEQLPPAKTKLKHRALSVAIRVARDLSDCYFDSIRRAVLEADNPNSAIDIDRAFGA